MFANEVSELQTPARSSGELTVSSRAVASASSGHHPSTGGALQKPELKQIGLHHGLHEDQELLVLVLDKVGGINAIEGAVLVYRVNNLYLLR